MLTLAFGPASDTLSGAPTGNAEYPVWFGWYRCKKGEGIKRLKNSETYVAYFITQGKFKILSEGQKKEVGAGTWIGFPPNTEYEVEATADNSVLIWVHTVERAVN